MIRNCYQLILRFALASCLVIFFAATASSQTLTILHTFSALNSKSNDDGANPIGMLVEGNDGNYYGTTAYGGSAGSGTVFKMTPLGELTTLHTFSPLNDRGSNSDGATPISGLTLGSDGDFYGTAGLGGTGGSGAVFKITPAGALTTLHNFSPMDSNGYNDDGADIAADLIQGHDGNFYGTAELGGSGGSGTVFKITPTGAFTTLHEFSSENSSRANNDGGMPYAGLTLSTNGDFYGTTGTGGLSGYGTVFKITSAGTLNTLLSFNAADGAYPYLGSLVQGNDGSFYGTTTAGGTSGLDGTVFRVSSSGALTTLINFTGANGEYPFGGLLQTRDGNFYGTTADGGSNGDGTLFEVTTSGALYTLVNFNGTDGSLPSATLIQGSDGNIYGSAYHGGANATGTLFKLTLDASVPLPTITSFAPSSGPVGTSVTITGTNLTGATVVGFQNAHATTFTVNGAGTQITATVPSGAATGPIAVLTPGGEAKSSTSFTVTAASGPPTITGFTPASGPIGTTVTITGTNLTGTTVVGFQGKHATSFTVNSQGTQITATVPSGAATGPIAVLTPNGEAKSSTSFTVTTATPVPTITSFSPASGAVGTTVVITGMNLTGATVVGFQGAHAKTFTVNGAGTQITTTVPSGAATGPIAVLTPGGEAKSGASFTVTP